MNHSIVFLAVLLLFSSNLFAQFTSPAPGVTYTNNKVGIGTHEPGALLHLDPKGIGGLIIGKNTLGTTSLSIYISEESNGYSNFQAIKSEGSVWGDIAINAKGGKVGIGTITPRTKLEVNGDFQVYPSGNAGTSGALKLRFVAGTASTIIEANSDYIWADHDIIINGGNKLSGNINQLVVHKTGSVGIGTANPGKFKLAVDGNIGAREIQVTTQNPFPDYVFEKDYKLLSLSEIEKFIQTNKHLPEVPSANEVEEAGGVNLGEMNLVLLKKVEELTLHMIELEKKNEEQQKQINELILKK